MEKIVNFMKNRLEIAFVVEVKVIIVTVAIVIAVKL